MTPPKRTPRVLPFKRKPEPPKPSVLDQKGGLQFSVSVTVKQPWKDEKEQA
jgi:hypothetical protein